MKVTLIIFTYFSLPFIISWWWWKNWSI